jgi:hypothetical protein
MKRNPIPENRGVRTKVARADSRSHPRIDVKPEPSGLTTLSDLNAVRKTKREIWRTALANKQAGSRDVLIISTAEYVRFIVTIKLPKSR